MEMLEVTYHAPVRMYPACVESLSPRYPHWKWGKEYEELVRKWDVKEYTIIDKMEDARCIT